MFLFKVEDSFMITGRGLVLTPGLGENKANLGDKIKIIRPDKTIIETSIKGVTLFSIKRYIYVGSSFTKEDVPINSDVWLIE